MTVAYTLIESPIGPLTLVLPVIGATSGAAGDSTARVSRYRRRATNGDRSQIIGTPDFAARSMTATTCGCGELMRLLLERSIDARRL